MFRETETSLLSKVESESIETDHHSETHQKETNIESFSNSHLQKNPFSVQKEFFGEKREGVGIFLEKNGA